MSFLLIIRYLYDMDCFSFPVINVEETSLRLKSIREQKGISVGKLQQLFEFNYPQAIYNWENPNDKTLPCLDNLVVLAKLYKVSIDELIIIKENTADSLAICEQKPSYGVSKEIINFIKQNTKDDVRRALGRFFECDL